VPVQVVEVDDPASGHASGHRHHARGRRLEQQGQQPHGEREGAEEVAAQLQLEAVGGFVAHRREHHSGVVEQ